jgi:hypothetical protein
MNRSAGVLWIVSGALFLGGSGIRPNLSMLVKCCHVWGLPEEVYTGRMWTGMRSVCVMLIRFSSTWCTSIRITVTLIYESLVYGSHHVDNLMNLMSLHVVDVVLLNTFNYLHLLLE